MELFLLMPLVLLAVVYLRLPRCLVCSRRLLPRRGKLYRCRCRVRYAKALVTERDRWAWEKVRKERLFSLSYQRDTGEHRLRFEFPVTPSKLGSHP